MEPPQRRTRRAGDRVAGPAHRRRLRPAARRRQSGVDPKPYRARTGCLFFSHQTGLAARLRPRCARTSRAGRTGVWDHRQLFGIQTERSACDGCEQCFAHDAVQCAFDALGPGLARSVLHPRLGAAGGGVECAGSGAHRAAMVWAADCDCRDCGRPASGDVRPGVPPARPRGHS